MCVCVCVCRSEMLLSQYDDIFSMYVKAKHSDPKVSIQIYFWDLACF